MWSVAMSSPSCASKAVPCREIRPHGESEIPLRNNPYKEGQVARWSAERWAASSGIAFGIILIVSNFLAGTPPHYNASSEKIVSFLSDHHRALVVSSLLGGVMIVLFLWFVASFAGMYREAGQRR